MIDEMNKQLVQQAGFSIGEDPDQDGFYQWSRQENGRTVEGCDSSFQEEDQAWEEAMAMMMEACLDESNLTQQEWDGLLQDQKLAIVAQAFD